MKTAVAICAALLLRESTALAQARVDWPAGTRVEQIALTADGTRRYYTTPTGDLWLFDSTTGKNDRVATGSIWDVTVSPSRNALAYTKATDARQQHVWVLPLDANTGQPSGAERRVSANSGDVPAISPDGQSVAFARDDANGVGQTIVVVPMNGGAERVVAASLPSSVGSLRWTPDGNALVFGVNAPVPFTCAESCLSIPGGTPRVLATIRRVAVSGGPVTTITFAGRPWPGLSPDGTKLAFTDQDDPRKLVIADAAGAPLKTITLEPTQTLQGWFGAESLVAVSSPIARTLRSVSARDGQSSVLLETNDVISSPAWSPGGRSASVLHSVGDRCEVQSMSADGTRQRSVTLPDRGCGSSLAWGADGRSVFYTQYLAPDRRPAIMKFDMTTDQTIRVHEGKPGDLSWVLDGSAVIVAEIPNAPGPQRTLTFRRIDSNGNTTLLREWPFTLPGGFGVPLDASSAFIGQPNPPSFSVIPLAGNEAGQSVTPITNGVLMAKPVISSDRQWVAFALPTSGNDLGMKTLIDLARVDGTARRRVELPFFLQGVDSIVILRGASQLVVSERPSSLTTDPGVYLVDVAAGSARKLFDYSARGRPAEFALSPDGEHLLVITWETLPPSLSVIDVSAPK